MKHKIIVVAKVKLYPTQIERLLLYDTLQRNRAALNAVSKIAFEKGISNANTLQKETYSMIRL